MDANTLVLQADTLAPIQDAIVNNLGVLLPVGLTIFGIMIAVSLIPRIIYKFM